MKDSNQPTPQTFDQLQQDIRFLWSRGWLEKPCASPWRWYEKKHPGVYRTLHDAISLERSRRKA
jgi:hypothetical protein